MTTELGVVFNTQRVGGPSTGWTHLLPSWQISTRPSCRFPKKCNVRKTTLVFSLPIFLSNNNDQEYLATEERVKLSLVTTTKESCSGDSFNLANGKTPQWYRRKDNPRIHKGARCLWNNVEGTLFSDQMTFCYCLFFWSTGFSVLPIVCPHCVYALQKKAASIRAEPIVLEGEIMLIISID